jgi:hypothetical protein
MFENKRWLIIPTSITGSINFNEINENSLDALRVSLDGNEVVVSYDINEVTSSYTLEYVHAETGELNTTEINEGMYGRPSFYSENYEEYNYNDILTTLNGDKWFKSI